jgi:hypothetical protein
MRTGRPVEDILETLLEDARRSKDKQARIRIRRAQKFIKERNRSKRERRG